MEHKKSFAFNTCVSSVQLLIPCFGYKEDKDREAAYSVGLLCQKGTQSYLGLMPTTDSGFPSVLGPQSLWCSQYLEAPVSEVILVSAVFCQ